MLVLWQLLWSNVLVAAVLAVLATGLSALFRRPALTHGLWLLVLLKLVTPPLVPVTVVLPAPAKAPEERAAPTPEPDPEPEPAAEEEEEEGILAPLEMIGRPAGPRPRAARPEAAAANPDRQDFAPAADPAPTPDDPAGNRGDVTFPWIPVLVSVWLMTSLAWFVVAGVRVRRFQRLLRHARAADPALRRQVAELSRRLGLRQAPPTWLVEGCVSPLVWMVGGRARLLLPAGLMGRLTEEQRDTLLLHELAHLRRGDPWVRWLEAGVTGLYWWLPLVWWARRELRQAEEECCDAWVVRALPGSSRAYAQALVETVDFLSGDPPALPALASGVGPVHLLRRRLTMILRGTTSPKMTALGLAALLSAGALVPLLPTWAQSPAEPPAQREDEQDRGARGKRDRGEDRDLQRAEREVQQMERALETLRNAQKKLHDKMAAHERQMQEALERLKAARGKMAQGERAKGTENPMRGGGVPAPKGFGGGMAGRGDTDQRLRELERKLDAVLREVKQLRNELKKGGRGPSADNDGPMRPGFGAGFPFGKGGPTPGFPGGKGGFGGGRGFGGNNPFPGDGAPPTPRGFRGPNPPNAPGTPTAPNPPTPPADPADPDGSRPAY